MTTWLLMGAVAGCALLVGGIGGAIACGLGRIGAESDRMDQAAWERRERLQPFPPRR